VSWRTFGKVLELNGGLRVKLVVDELVPHLAWALHEACGTEILFYVRKVVEESVGKGDPPQLTLYLIIEDPSRDVYIPVQRASPADVKVEEPAPLEYSYAVVHTHPPGVKSFSSVDKEYINVNHVVSVLVESGEVTDARVTLNLGGLVAQVKPEVIVARRRASFSLRVRGVRGVRALRGGEGLIRCYAKELATRLLSESAGRIRGCKASGS
jgi:hypothetical protein